MRECSRKRPSSDRTRIVSESPGTPGRRQQMPRTRRSIGVPAADAAYSSSMASGSTNAFIFITMRPDDDPAVPLGARIPGERVEELGEVGADLGIRGEQPDVLVEVRRHRVVV